MRLTLAVRLGARLGARRLPLPAALPALMPTPGLLTWLAYHPFPCPGSLSLQVRTSCAVPVQGASLALALHRLPGAYVASLGRLDTVHVLLLSLLLVAGAGAGLAMGRSLERQARQAWLERRRRRGELMSPATALGPPPTAAAAAAAAAANAAAGRL